MNLRKTRAQIKNLSDYRPEDEVYDTDVDTFINNAIDAVWTQNAWTFTQRSALLNFNKDITSTSDTENSAGLAINIGILSDTREVTFSSDIDRLDQRWEGHSIVLNQLAYTISKVVDHNTILLSEAYRGDTLVDYEDWSIHQRIYVLPEDCVEVLYLGHRQHPYEGGSTSYKIGAVIARTEEMNMGYTRNTSSDFAAYYVNVSNIFVQPAEKTGIKSVPGGNFTADQSYEITWAFRRNGNLSALAEPEEYVVDEDNTAIEVSFLGWDEELILNDGIFLNDKEAPFYEGFEKVVYWNKNYDRVTGERTGIPCWIEVISGGATRNDPKYLKGVVGADIEGKITITDKNQFFNGATRYREVDGQHKAIRPEPRVNSHDIEVPQQKVGQDIVVRHDFIKQAVLRYKAKPPYLQLDTDSPRIPSEFHTVILYQALVYVFNKMNQKGSAQDYQTMADDRIKSQEENYLVRTDNMLRKGQFDSIRGFRHRDDIVWLG